MTDTRIERARYALNPDGWACVLQEEGEWPTDQWVTILDGPESGVRRWYNKRNLRALAILSEPSDEESEPKLEKKRSRLLERYAHLRTKEPEADERVLLWDRGLQGYCAEPGEMVHDYRKAKQYKRGVFDLLSPDGYALADLSGWVESWGEQPVSNGTHVEVRLPREQRAMLAARLDWAEVTHFRLPLPEQESAPPRTTTDTVIQDRSSEFDWPRTQGIGEPCDLDPYNECATCGAEPWEHCQWEPEPLTPEAVRCIVREELAAIAQVAYQDSDSATALPALGALLDAGKRRADELEGGES